MTNIEVSAFIADSAELVQGKIYALGIGWNSIYTEQFPCTHPRMALGILLTVPYTATNRNHKLTVTLQTEDGQKVALQTQVQPNGEINSTSEVDANFTMGRTPLLPAGDAQILPIAMTFDQLRFEQQGVYTWVVEIDGTPVTRIPIRLSQLNVPQHI